MLRLLTFFIVFVLPSIGLAQSSTSVALYNKLGREAGLRNDSTVAALNFEKALALDSLNQVARSGYALTHRNAKAYDLLTEMITHEPEDTSLHVIRAYCTLTLEKSSKKTGDFTQANIWFGHTIADYQWLIENGSNINLSKAHMDEAEAIWNGSYAPDKNIVAVSHLPVKMQTKLPVMATKNERSTPLIGKSIHSAGLNEFLINQLGYRPVATPYTITLGDDENLARYKFAVTTSSNASNATLSVSYYLHNDGTIEKLDISGEESALMQLFKTYWPDAQSNRPQRVISYQTANEKITYTSRGSGLANISIKKL